MIHAPRSAAIVAAACTFGLSHDAAANDSAKLHRFELDALGGLRVGGSRRVDLDPEDDATDGSSGRLTARPSPSWGVQASVRVQPNGFVYLLYSRQFTRFEFRADAPGPVQEGEGSIEYIHFGGRLQAPQGQLRPYFGFSMGGTRVHSVDAGRGRGRFSVAFEPGVDFSVLPFLHVRALARLPMTFGAGELYCYSEQRCAVAFEEAPFAQGEIQVGLGLQF